MAQRNDPSHETICVNNSEINGRRLTIRGNGNTIAADYSEIYGDGNVISGRRVRVAGNNNRITGDYAEIHGSGNIVDGRRTKTTGNDNRVAGDYAEAEGNNNAIRGRSAKAVGNNNNVAGEYATATGNNNTVQGRKAEANGASNTVTGEYARATGQNNSVNGVAAEVAMQQQQQQLQQQLQYYSQRMQQQQLAPEQLPPEQYMEYITLLLQYQSQQLVHGLLQTFQPLQFQQQLQNTRQPFTPIAPSSQEQLRSEQPTRQWNAGQVPEMPATGTQPKPIELVLRGEDCAVDENGQECCVCYENTAVVASVCCGKLSTCLKCTRTLYEGKLVGQAKCINCRGDVSHVVRIS